MREQFEINESPLWNYLRPAFSRKQRQWIVDRDEEKCVAPFNHRCNTDDKPKQVHHILPQGYCKTVGIDDPDFPENGITLCQNAHDVIHPDVPGARYEYSQDNGSFGKLREQRNQKLQKRQPYWNTAYDRQMSVVAVRNTQRFSKLSKFPEK